jgi:hypothetical protein
MYPMRLRCMQLRPPPFSSPSKVVWQDKTPPYMLLHLGHNSNSLSFLNFPEFYRKKDFFFSVGTPWGTYGLPPRFVSITPRDLRYESVPKFPMN